MSKLTFEKAFFCLKLKTGETLFTEVLDVDEVSMMVMNPMLIVTDLEKQSETITLVPWVPFVVRNVFPLPMNMIFFADNLNSRFLEYYGRTVLQFEINKIKQKVYDEMESREDVVAMSAGLDEMKKVSEELSLKFGVEGPDFSDFEAVLERYKENIVMH